MDNDRIAFFAALLTPTDSSGKFNPEALSRNIEFVIGAGIDGICVNGVTGEYPCFNSSERRAVAENARAFAKGRCRLIVGIGATTLDESVALGRHALDQGADALLLSPPHFFRYEPQDVACFYNEAASRLDGSILIYNIPVFTNPVESRWIARLVAETPNIIGVKDSSGSIESLIELRKQQAQARWIGNDSKISEALSSGAANGLISGVAGVFPEVVGALVSAHRTGEEHASAELVLLEIIKQIEIFPTPWGLKLLAQCRGLGDAHFATPVSNSRRQALTVLEEWFERWSCDHRLLSVA